MSSIWKSPEEKRAERQDAIENGIKLFTAPDGSQSVAVAMFKAFVDEIDDLRSELSDLRDSHRRLLERFDEHRHTVE